MKIKKISILIGLLIIYFLLHGFNGFSTIAYGSRSLDPNLTLFIDFSGWKRPDAVPLPKDPPPKTDQELLFSFNNSWQVYSGFTRGNDKGGPVITPEPIGSMLFILGSGMLVIFTKRKNKNKV